MIGSTFKKYASEFGMQTKHGVAFGDMNGFAATFSEGAGYKQIQFSTTFPYEQAIDSLNTKLNEKNIRREFRVEKITLTPFSVSIVFHDNPGTMKKIRAFMEYFFPILRESGATGTNICPKCGETIENGQWRLLNGMAYHFHEDCAKEFSNELDDSYDQAQREDDGSYLNGFFGALLGSIAGAIVWAIVLMMGYVASVVGLLIGFLAERGYKLLHGRSGKGKVVILLIAVIVGVLLGTVGGWSLQVADLIRSGELPGATFADIPAIMQSILSDPEAMRELSSDVITGFIYAGLGVAVLIWRAGKEVARPKVKNLND